MWQLNMGLIRVKKAFTLIELIIVIVLISTSYFLVFSNSFSVKKDEKILDLFNLKEYLLNNFEFEKELSFLCIEDDFSCYIKTDAILNKDFKVTNFFKTKPNIYRYNSDEEKVEFEELRVNNTNHNVIFELKINSDYKTNEFIADTLDSGIFVFNSIFTKPKIYKSLNESFEIFNINKTKVKDAF
jgi:prepilin-type N-terminal cleavage/methylation domain-containing protein